MHFILRVLIKNRVIKKFKMLWLLKTEKAINIVYFDALTYYTSLH